MTANDAAEMMGISAEQAEAYLRTCGDVAEDAQYVATLKGNTVHILANVKGLGGRGLLKQCRNTLKRWFAQQEVLYAPVKHGNEKAVKLAQALGFHQYATTDTHVWLMQTKEHFDES